MYFVVWCQACRWSSHGLDLACGKIWRQNSGARYCLAWVVGAVVPSGYRQGNSPMECHGLRWLGEESSFCRAGGVSRAERIAGKVDPSNFGSDFSALCRFPLDWISLSKELLRSIGTFRPLNQAAFDFIRSRDKRWWSISSVCRLGYPETRVSWAS